MMWKLMRVSQTLTLECCWRGVGDLHTSEVGTRLCSGAGTQSCRKGRRYSMVLFLSMLIKISIELCSD